MRENAQAIVVQSPSGRESLPVKARRYLAEGRVEVVRRVLGVAIADVRGTEEIHRVMWEQGRGWSCTCPAGTYRPCSHRLAVSLVVAPDRGTS
jgi:uncharacterized Zn finger protein